jgi:hypothetical protein
MVTAVRNWLTNEAGVDIPGPFGVWSDFNDFTADDRRRLKSRSFFDKDITVRPVKELMSSMKVWVAKR